MPRRMLEIEQLIWLAEHSSRHETSTLGEAFEAMLAVVGGPLMGTGGPPLGGVCMAGKV